MWWRDYLYRERNLNRVSSLDELIIKVNNINLSPKRIVIIIDKSQILYLKKSIDFKIITEFNDKYLLIINKIDNVYQAKFKKPVIRQVL